MAFPCCASIPYLSHGQWWQRFEDAGRLYFCLAEFTRREAFILVPQGISIRMAVGSWRFLAQNINRLVRWSRPAFYNSALRSFLDGFAPFGYVIRRNQVQVLSLKLR